MNIPVSIQTQVPSAPLTNFVEMFWCFEGGVTPHDQERLLPTGTTELVFNLRENHTRTYNGRQPSRYEDWSGSIVSGPHSECFVIDSDAQASVVGVHFKPGGAWPFFPIPAAELHNRHVALADLWG